MNLGEFLEHARALTVSAGPAHLESLSLHHVSVGCKRICRCIAICMGTWVVVHVRMREFVWKPEAKIGFFPSHYLPFVYCGNL